MRWRLPDGDDYRKSLPVDVDGREMGVGIQQLRGGQLSKVGARGGQWRDEDNRDGTRAERQPLLSSYR